MTNLLAKMEDAKLEYAVLVSKIDLFGCDMRNDIICILIDKCEDNIDHLRRTINWKAEVDAYVKQGAMQ